MRGLRELAVVVGGATIFAIALTFPFTAQMTHVGRVDNFDAQFGIWNVAWVARTLVIDPAHVLDANIFYPHHRTLVYSETNLGAGALAIPAYWVTRNPYFAFNFVFLLSLVMSAAGGYYLVRYLIGDRGAAAVSGIAFAFCPYVFARTPQIQLLMTAGLPFTMLAFHRAADRPTKARGVVLGLVMAAQVAFCGYYAVFAMLIVGFATFTLAGIRRLWTNAAYWTTIATAALVGLVVALPVLVPYVQLQQSTGFGRTLADASRYSADWRAYLASSAVAHRWMLTAIGHWNEVLFPGFVATIAGLAGLAIGVRKPDLIRSGPLSPDVRSGADRPVQSGADRSIQSGADRPVQNGTDRPVQNGADRPVQSGADLIRSANANAREISILYGSLGALALWASFGPRAGLYTFLYRVLPPFSLMRAPARFGIIVTLALTVLAGIAVRVVLERSARPGLLGVLLALATAAELAFPLHFRQVPALAPAYRMLATLPRGPVLELPFWSTNRDRFGHALYMMNSTAHWMPLINGYSDYIPPDALEAAPVLSLFPSRDSFSRLASQRPRYAVFHMNLFGVEDRAAAAARIREFAPYLRPLYTDAETQLYEIVGFPP